MVLSTRPLASPCRASPTWRVIPTNGYAWAVEPIANSPTAHASSPMERIVESSRGHGRTTTRSLLHRRDSRAGGLGLIDDLDHELELARGLRIPTAAVLDLD